MTNANLSISADPGVVFLTGLSRHLPHSRLPDGGLADEAIGGHLRVVFDRPHRQAIDELPAAVAAAVLDAAARTVDETTPEGRALRASEVTDHVLQIHRHARAAAFTVERTLDEFGLAAGARDATAFDGRS